MLNSSGICAGVWILKEKKMGILISLQMTNTCQVRGLNPGLTRAFSERSLDLFLENGIMNR